MKDFASVDFDKPGSGWRAPISPLMRGGQCLKEPSIGVGGVAGGAGFEPLLQIGQPIYDPSPKLTVNWPVSIEPEFRERAFGQADKAGRNFRRNDFGNF
jgi:hypothetical protein